jgi:DNA invertase Pin-like site-specific DNA recombinase
MLGLFFVLVDTLSLGSKITDMTLEGKTMSNGQKIGYIRVSSAVGQKTDRQLADMIDQDQLDEIFTDKASGKNTDRPAFQEMLRHVRKGDQIFAHSMDRIARNLIDLRSTVDELVSRGISITFKKENLTFNNDNNNPMSNLLLNIMGSFAEFERSLINERQAEGIAIAKKKGVYKGRKHSLTPEQVKDLKARVEEGNKKAVVARDFGISRETLYRYLRA